jgi:hypothetical protein
MKAPAPVAESTAPAPTPTVDRAIVTTLPLHILGVVSVALLFSAGIGTAFIGFILISLKFCFSRIVVRFNLSYNNCIVKKECNALRQ